MATGLTNQGTTLADIRDAGDPNSPPVIDSLPEPLFLEGTASSYDMSQHVSDPEGDTLTLTLNGALAQGLAWSAPNLTYDGLGPASTSTGFTLTADDGSLQTTSDEFTVEVRPIEEPGIFPIKRNLSGGVTNAASNYLHDPTRPHYLLPRTTSTILFQPRDLWQPSTRSRWVEEFNHINHINPLCLMFLHQAPLHNTPGFRTARGQKSGPYTWYAQNTTNRDGGIDRKDAMLSIDGTDNNLLQTNSQTATTNIFKQAGWTLRVTNPQMRRYMADVAIDALTGSDRSGYGMGEGNMADFMVYWHDGTDVLNPKGGAALRAVVAQGTIDSILESKTSNPQQPLALRIDDDPAFPTTGTLPQDSSYGETDEAHALWCYPPTGTTGFIGYHVIGYKAASGGKADLYLKELSSRIAHDNQYHVPEAGWRYCLNTEHSGHSNPDWDGDGVNSDRFTVESWHHAAAFKEYFDLINEGVLEENGTNTMRTANAFSSSLTVKRSAGLPHPSAFDGMWDVGHAESCDGNGLFSHESFKNSTRPNQYDCSNTKIERLMRALHWSSNALRPNQGGWMADKPRGAMIEIDVWGDEDYSTLNEVDTSFARFFWALGLMVPNCFQVIRQADSTYFPCLLEEAFIDLDSYSSDPAPLGIYAPGEGTLGSAGHPVGKWTWATGGSGDLTDGEQRIYLRRIGNWLIAINAADAPNDYDIYAPSHLSNEYNIRDAEDTIKPADFAQLVTDGVLDAGYTLTHYDPTTYYNPNVTAKLRELRPSVWNGFNWGPAQPHPDDSDNGLSHYTLANVPWMLRDRIKNDGSVVDTSVNYDLAPLEAVAWHIT